MNKMSLIGRFARIAITILFCACSSNVQKPGPGSGPPPPPPIESLGLSNPAENQEVIGDTVLSGPCVDGSLVAVNINSFPSFSVQCSNKIWDLSFAKLNGFSGLGAEETFMVYINQTDQPSISRQFKTMPDKGDTPEDEEFASCADIKLKHPSTVSDEYYVTLDLEGKEIKVYCDMDTKSGGWTGLTAKVVYDFLRETTDDKSVGAKIINGNATIEESTSYPGVYCSKETGDGGHTAQYVFNIPFGYKEFYINEFFEVRPSLGGNNQISQNKDYWQTEWRKAQFAGTYGDISFGSPEKATDKNNVERDMVITSYARHDAYECSLDKGCVSLPWGDNSTNVFSLNDDFPTVSDQTKFSIGWGAAGAAKEGWCIWHKKGISSDAGKQAMIFFR